jgi:hypothetical protein
MRATEAFQRMRAIQAGNAAKPPLKVDVVKIRGSNAVHPGILQDAG